MKQDEVLQRFEQLVNRLEIITKEIEQRTMTTQVSEPQITFTPANENANDDELKNYEQKMYRKLDEINKKE